MNRFCLHIIFVLFVSLISSTQLFATHNRAGEITFRHLYGFTYEITVITYTEATSSANRDNIDVFFGDNTKSNVLLDFRESRGNSILYNRYKTTHTYSGYGSYIISFFDPNRVENVVNMYSSVLTPFYVETELQISRTKGPNRSPVLLQDPIDFAEKGKVYKHNPNAYDPDGDSLVFSLIPPKQDVGRNVDGYYLPYGFNGFKLNRYTGDLMWDYPDTVGIFNIAILIEEYRNKQRIGYMIRDMQIIVGYKNNNPPRIDPINDTCIEAGRTFVLSFNVKATDIDIPAEKVTLSAKGGPFIQNISPAFISPAMPIGYQTVTATFTWTPACNHIRKEPYSVVFKAEDNHFPTALADLEHFFIKVIGPAPQNVVATPSLNSIKLTWDPPPGCLPKGYYIYRKVDSSAWDTSLCETGVPSWSGFRFIDSIHGYANTFYDDNNLGKGLVPGITYCYRITAFYLNEGNFELVEGYASPQVCATMRKQLPVITHVSVRHTHESNGSIYIDWSLPSQLDTVVYKPPYRIMLNRSTSGSPDVILNSYTANALYLFNDSVFIDTMINTRDKQYFYTLSFFSSENGSFIGLGSAQGASSVFLNVKQGHKNLFLSWNENVPWNNDYYIIYRKNKSSGLFDSIGYTYSRKYYDMGLVNGITQCYKVQSHGHFVSELFPDPILNFSQEVCSFPRDTIPPCTPFVRAEAFCEPSYNEVHWWYQDSLCAQDVVKFRIYFSERMDNDFKLVAEVPGGKTRFYRDNRSELTFNLAGCYMITAVDSYDNESVYSNQSCVDNCPKYLLPNIFTPNGDGVNDEFKALEGSKYIERINLTIFNRWGQLVYQTSNPSFIWDGHEQDKGKPCSDGVYYYICDVYEMYLEGNKTSFLSGTITILR